MSAVSPAVTEPIFLRNSRGILAVLRITACAGFVFAASFALIGLSSFEKGFTWDHARDAAGWAFGAILSIRGAIALWRGVCKMGRNAIRLTSEGVHFHFKSTKVQPEVFFAWNEIAKITLTSSKSQNCCVYSTDGRVIRFSSFSFLRPKQVARVIARHAGRTVDEA